MHVPLIIKQEGNDRAGTRVPGLVQLIDVVPTILDLVKAPIPGDLRGRSLKDLLDGGTRRAASAAYAEASYGRSHFGWSELTSVTDGRYRYIKAPREELYDLERDPDERENLMVPGPQASMAGPADAVRSTRTKTVDSASDEQALQSLRDALARVVSDSVPSAPAAGLPDAFLPDPKDTYQILEDARHTMEQGLVGKAIDVPIGQTAAGRMREHGWPLIKKSRMTK